MVSSLLLAAAFTAQPPPLRLELVNKPGRTPFKKFELQMRITNISDHPIEMAIEVEQNVREKMDIRDLLGNDMRRHLGFTYITIGPIRVSELGVGSSREGNEIWHYHFDNPRDKKRITIQAIFNMPPLIGAKPGDPRVVTGPYLSNKLLLEVGAGYVDVLENDLYKPAAKKP